MGTQAKEQVINVLFFNYQLVKVYINQKSVDYNPYVALQNYALTTE